MEQETICWHCQNFAKCSWNKGTPVKDWIATPTEIAEERHGKAYTVHSFCVHSCPLFVEDKFCEMSAYSLSKFLGISHSRFFGQKLSVLAERLRIKGYKLHIYDFNEDTPTYLLEKISSE